MIKNPILTGFNGDPSICKKGDEFFVATSSLEWFPAVPVYHSKDLKHWELYANCLMDESECDLRRLSPSKGVWAPCLSYNEIDDMFFLVYGIMNSMNADYFDIDNYLTTAKDLKGPWSKSVYLHSAGFDASLFHDEDKKYLVSLEWETREGYEHPGGICLAEYFEDSKKIIGYPKRIYDGGTDRGCLEGPHMYKRNGFYYLLCAEGGTGYGHCVSIGRSKNIWGPYEAAPNNPILTSAKCNFFGRDKRDFLKPQYFNESSKLQKSGHASIIETSLGDTYLVHHIGRPLLPELRCTLGRETAIQEMQWTDDNWLELKGGGNEAKEFVNEPNLKEFIYKKLDDMDLFDKGLRNDWYAPRIDYKHFASIDENQLILRGQESLCSLNRVSLIAKKMTSLETTVMCKMHFNPKVYQHNAGLVLFYDNMNYAFLRKYYSESMKSPALGILLLNNGEKTEFKVCGLSSVDDSLWIKMKVIKRKTQFYYSCDGINYSKAYKVLDTSVYSDEYSDYGEFTGAFVGLACVDSMLHENKAYFDFFKKESNDDADVI